MARYEGKGQPPIALGWFGDGPSWWGGTTPNYVGVVPVEARRQGAIAYATGPKPNLTTIGVPAPSAVGGVPTDGQPSRTIAIVIPRETPSGDLKR